MKSPDIFLTCYAIFMVVIVVIGLALAIGFIRKVNRRKKEEMAGLPDEEEMELAEETAEDKETEMPVAFIPVGPLILPLGIRVDEERGADRFRCVYLKLAGFGNFLAKLIPWFR